MRSFAHHKRDLLLSSLTTLITTIEPPQSTTFLQKPLQKRPFTTL
jgi:hypothetical protein